MLARSRMLALSIRQPYAELILRGEKRIEYRSRPTKLIGQRFYIYASRTWAGVTHGNGHDAAGIEAGGPGSLPTGVIVGSAIISGCEVAPASCLCGSDSQHERLCDQYEWHLTNVKRYKRLRAPRRHPQPVWFTPW